jgi:hypothetical protein
MWTAIKWFFGWIGSLMRRRKFIATQSTTPTVPPSPGSLTIPLILLLLEEL